MNSQSPSEFGRRSDPSSATGSGLSGSHRTIASYRTYAEAEKAVDHLSDNKFPVENVAIVGRGLSTVEQVTGRLTTWTAAGRSAISGVIVGALLGWILGLFNLVDPLVAAVWLALWGALIGAVVGALIGLATHAMTGGRRDFSSIGALSADSYDLQVDTDHADEAARLLEGLKGGSAASSAGPRTDRPT